MRAGQGNVRRSFGTGQAPPRAILLACACAILALGLWLWRGDRGPDGAGIAPAAAQATPAGLLSHLARPEGFTADMGPAPARRASSQDGAQRQARQAPSGRRALDASDDLFAYSQRLQPALRAGDPEAAWLTSRVVDHCAGYAADPAAFARDSALLAAADLPAAKAMSVARSRIASRCGRFTAADGLSPARVRTLRLQAAQGGSLPAEAELLARGEPLSTGADYAASLLDRIGSAADADAFGALSTAVEVPRWLSSMDLDVAPQYQAITWQMAACRMGADCGPGSMLMTSYCVHGGICSRDPGQGFEQFVYDAAIPRQSVDHVRTAVDALVDRFGGAP